MSVGDVHPVSLNLPPTRVKTGGWSDPPIPEIASGKMGYRSDLDQKIGFYIQTGSFNMMKSAGQ